MYVLFVLFCLSTEKKFEDPPQCVKDTREFCERHMREQLMSQYEKENRVR